MGYRWYDQKNITPLWPFGHGLSYTTFAYTNLKVSGTVRLSFFSLSPLLSISLCWFIQTGCLRPQRGTDTSQLGEGGGIRSGPVVPELPNLCWWAPTGTFPSPLSFLSFFYSALSPLQLLFAHMFLFLSSGVEEVPKSDAEPRSISTGQLHSCQGWHFHLGYLFHQSPTPTHTLTLTLSLSLHSILLYYLNNIFDVSPRYQ